MVIKNECSYVLEINGENLDPMHEITVEEKVFNIQSVFSDVGGIEIVTEYGERNLHCYGQIIAYEDEERKDFDGLPYIVIIDRKGDNYELLA